IVRKCGAGPIGAQCLAVGATRHVDGVVKPDGVADESAVMDQRRAPIRFVEQPPKMALIVIVPLRLGPGADQGLTQFVSALSSQRAPAVEKAHAHVALAETILPGLRGGSPLGSASTASMPDVTSPQTVYWLSRKRASPKQMKNWLLAEFGSLVRAIEQTPRTWGSAENSCFRFGFEEPPVPLKFFPSPPCAMKPSITR